jgi:hypothetical protein
MSRILERNGVRKEKWREPDEEARSRGYAAPTPFSSAARVRGLREIITAWAIDDGHAVLCSWCTGPISWDTKGTFVLRLRRIAFLPLLLIPELLLAATFRGRSVDGRRFDAAIVNDDFGAFTGVEVKFSGHNATVYMRGNTQLHLVLQEEDIVDPRHIVAHDDRRGVDWEINIRNLREATEGAR